MSDYPDPTNIHMETLNREARTSKPKPGQWYIFFVWKDVEPSIKGPYKTEAKRNQEITRLRDNSTDHGVFALDIAPDGTPSVE